MAEILTQNPGSSEVQSPIIAGFSEALNKISQIMDMDTEELTNVQLFPIEIDGTDSNTNRIYEAPNGKRLWLENPIPIIKKNNTVISNYTIDYIGGSITFDSTDKPTNSDVITVTCKHIINKSNEFDIIKSALNGNSIPMSGLTATSAENRLDYVLVSGETTQAGTGTPAPNHVMSITGVGTATENGVSIPISAQNENVSNSAEVIIPNFLYGNDTIKDSIESNILSGCDKQVILEHKLPYVLFTGENNDVYFYVTDGKIGGNVFSNQLAGMTIQEADVANRQSIHIPLSSFPDSVTNKNQASSWVYQNPQNVWYQSINYNFASDKRICKYTQNWKEITFNGSETGWTLSTTVPNQICIGISDALLSQGDNFWCDVYAPTTNTGASQANNTCGFDAANGFVIKDDRFTSLNSALAVLSAQPVNLVYQLSSPNVFAFSPVPLQNPEGNWEIGQIDVNAKVLSTNIGTGGVNAPTTVADTLYDLAIYGTSTQDGTPSPENPVPIVSAGDSGTVDVNLTGANLLSMNATGIYTGTNGTVVENNSYRSTVIQFYNKNIFISGNFSLLNSGIVRIGKFNEFPSVGVTGVRSAISSNGNVSNDGYKYALLSFFPENASFDDVKNSFMCNYGDLQLPYAPYSEQAINLQTPNGLPGIPVKSGGNWTDENGQQWISDVIDFGAGTLTQKILQAHFDGDKSESWYLQSINTYGIANFGTALRNVYETNGEPRIISNRFTGQTSVIAQTQTPGILIVNDTLYIRISSQIASDVESFRTWLSANPVDVLVPLTTPTTTQLDTDTLAAYKALQSYDGTTNVIAQNCGIRLVATSENQSVVVNPQGFLRALSDANYADYAGALKTPVSIGNALFNGSQSISLSEMGVPAFNYLINTNFLNPVNQRKASGVVSAAGFFIDRWKLESGTVQLTEDGLVLNGTITQTLENSLGMPFVASASAGTANYNDATKTFTLTASGETIAWAKLETGTVATPWAQRSYGEELADCLRFFERIGGAYSNSIGNIAYTNGQTVMPLTLNYYPKRAIPTVTFSATSQYRALWFASNGIANGQVPVTNITQATTPERSSATFIVSTQLPTSSMFALLQRQDTATSAYVDVSAEL